MSTLRPGPQSYRRQGQVLDSTPIAIKVKSTAHTSEGRGSAALERRIRVAIANFADEHRITDNEARILLLNTGIRL